jgi:hypothetical protein
MAEEGEPPVPPLEHGALVGRLRAAGGEDGRLAAEIIERQDRARVAHAAKLRAAKRRAVADRLRTRRELEAENASLREENATLHGKLAHDRAGTQPEAGGHGAQPGVDPGDPEPSASTGTMKTVIQTVGGAAPPPDFEAGALRDATVTGDLVAV